MFPRFGKLSRVANFVGLPTRSTRQALRRLVRAPPEGPWGQWSSSRRRTQPRSAQRLRYPVISREGKTLDYLFVCDDSIISRWQHTTHVLQMERSMKRNCLAACPYRHLIRPWVGCSCLVAAPGHAFCGRMSPSAPLASRLTPPGASNPHGRSPLGDPTIASQC